MPNVATKFAPNPSAFETAVGAGFEFAEFWLDAALLEDWTRIADLAAAHPMRYAIHFPNPTNLEDRHLVAVVELARAVDATAVVIHDPSYDLYADRLRELDAKLPLAVENLRLSPEAFEHWGCTYPGLTLDIEHLWAFTLGDVPRPALLDRVEDVLARWGDRLRHVHLPGYVPGHAHHRPMYCSRDLVFAAFDLLEANGFEGLVTAEASERFQNPNELRMDRLLYETWCASRGREACERTAVPELAAVAT